MEAFAASSLPPGSNACLTGLSGKGSTRHLPAPWAARPVRGLSTAMWTEDAMFQLETRHTALGPRGLDRLRTILAIALVGVALAMGALAWMP